MYVYLHAHIHRSFAVYSFPFLTFVFSQCFQVWAKGRHLISSLLAFQASYNLPLDYTFLYFLSSIWKCRILAEYIATQNDQASVEITSFPQYYHRYKLNMYYLTRHSGHTVITISLFPPVKGSDTAKKNCLNKVKFTPARMPLYTSYFYILFENYCLTFLSALHRSLFYKDCLGETCSFHINSSLWYLSSLLPSNVFVFKQLFSEVTTPMQQLLPM